ncbi:SDR family NAD(P)-dependent oxidoreductase [Tepidiphilus sp. HLB4]
MSQVALVTGAASGLGYIIANKLHTAGYAVAVTDHKAKLATDAVARLGGGDRLLPIELNVKHKEDFERALGFIIGRWGGLQVVVNNAAITPTTSAMMITPDEFDEVIAVNLRGTFFGCQVFGSYMAKVGYGRIINMASLAGQNGGTTAGAHYAASKGAIITLTKIFARELASANVTVNAIAPGPLDLPSVRAAMSPTNLEKLINNMIPVKRLGNPEFVADLIVSIASPSADFTTGATWDVNGGIFMR